MLHIWLTGNFSQLHLQTPQTNHWAPLLPGQPGPHFSLRRQHDTLMSACPAFPSPHCRLWKLRIRSLLCSNLCKAPQFTYSLSELYHHLHPDVTSGALPSLPASTLTCSPRTPLLLVGHSRCSPALGLLTPCHKTNIHLSLCINVTFNIVHTSDFPELTLLCPCASST